MITLPLGATVTTELALGVLLVAALVGVWFLIYAAALRSTRPSVITARPASADLPGAEPPAVVSMLANRWAVTEDAVESTLLDLAARHWVELRQPGNDPLHTTVHLRPPPAGDSLNAYEQQVYDHVRAHAVDDVVPVTALTFRDPGQANQWVGRLQASVVADARARGLSQRRMPPALSGVLSVLAAAPGGLAGVLFLTETKDPGPAFVVGVGLWTFLSGLASRARGERDTEAGREAAARWLGLRAFLRDDEAFAELPPAAVAVWDRYLSYGDALGVTRVAAAVLDLGMGDRKRVWSSYGGAWHPVRIRYPRVWGRYGKPSWKLLLWAAACLLVGGWLLRGFGADLGERPDGVLGYVGLIPAALGLYLVVRGVYRVARAGLDLAAPRELRGEVLWVELWRSTTARENKPSVPLVHYLAVDDGAGERTTAWALPSEEAHRAQPGDVVAIRVHPWSRRVEQLRVEQTRASRIGAPETAAPAPEPAPGAAAPGANVPGVTVPGVTVPGVPPAAAMVAAVASAQPRRVPLLGADDVGAALGRPVTVDGAAAQVSLGPFELTTYSAAADPSVPLLVLAVARGRAVALVVRGLRVAGKPLHVPAEASVDGPVDEAWAGPGWAAARRGDVLVRVSSDDAGVTVLPDLLRTALSRLRVTV